MKLVLMLAAIFAAAALPAEVRLASGGKTDYTIVLAVDKPIGDEEAAAEDLCQYLTKITGAKFTIGGDAPHKIYVGRKAPGDKAPLAATERRVRSENGDVYLYGNGWQGNTFAVYDFLDKFFGCRWYTFYGDERIPEKSEAVFADLALDVIPSYKYYDYQGGGWMAQVSAFERFRRASRAYDCRVKAAEPALSEGHVFGKIIPPGVDLGRTAPLRDPMEYFKDKAYFKTNPEFFSLMKNGKRYGGFQLCFSNPELRREIFKNLEIIIKHDYKGGPARISLVLNDKGHWGDKCCWCSECEKLNQKYGDNCGSYWDFILEASRYFKEKYPEINLLVYGYSMTRHTPTKGITTLPDNVIVSVAPLGQTDFVKPYRDTGVPYDDLKEWAPFSRDRMAWWIYPTVYPRPLWTYPLVANINRLVVNIRDAHELGVREIFAQFGSGPHSDAGFGELRMYLIACLARDVNADVPALTRDFMEHYYGAAAPLMLKYLAELEACEKAEKNVLRWWPDHRSALTYLTPENLLRWQRTFDEMEKLTRKDKAAHLHVRRARTNLDEATMSVWYKFAPGEMPDREMMHRRYLKTLRDSANDMLASMEPAKERPSRAKRLIQWRERSMYYHYALAGKWRPLPKRFAELPAGSVKRAVPHINRKTLERDVAGSATGIAIKANMPTEELKFMVHHWDGVEEGPREYLGDGLHLKTLREGEGRRKFYYIGTTKLYPDSMISTHQLHYASGVMTGHLFEPDNPEQLYNVYLALKPEGKTLWFDEMLLVKTDRKSRENKTVTEEYIDEAQ